MCGWDIQQVRVTTWSVRPRRTCLGTSFCALDPWRWASVSPGYSSWIPIAVRYACLQYVQSATIKKLKRQSQILLEDEPCSQRQAFCAQSLVRLPMLSLKDLESIWWLFSATDLVCIFMGGIQWASMKLDLQPRGFRMLRKFDKNKQTERLLVVKTPQLRFIFSSCVRQLALANLWCMCWSRTQTKQSFWFSQVFRTRLLKKSHGKR